MTERSTSSRRSAAPLMVSICPSAPSDTTPVAIRSRTVSMYRRRSSSCWFLRSRSSRECSSFCWLAASSPGHRVERFDERAKFVTRLGLDPVIEVAGADFAGAGGQPLHRPGNALGEVQARPGRTDHDHEGHHDEQRQVDTDDRPAQRAQLAPVLKRLDDLPGVRGRLSREPIACEHDADDLARRVADRGAASHELAASLERLGRVRLGAAARDERREVVGRRANAVARQSGRFHRDQRHDVSPLPRLRARSVHFDEPDSSLRDLGLDRAADGDEVARFDRCAAEARERFSPRGP